LSDNRDPWIPANRTWVREEIAIEKYRHHLNQQITPQIHVLAEDSKFSDRLAFFQALVRMEPRFFNAPYMEG